MLHPVVLATLGVLTTTIPTALAGPHTHSDRIDISVPNMSSPLTVSSQDGGNHHDTGSAGSRAARPAPPPFGHPMLAEFMLADYINLNHGSFGATPREVIAAQRAWVDQAEARPDNWFRTDYKTVLNDLRLQVARMINADDEDVTFVENASAAMNAIFRTIFWQPTDCILVLDTAYGMVKHTLSYVAAKYGVEIIYVEVPIPLTDDRQIDDAILHTLEQHRGKKIRMASFSHITSVPALILPVERLARLCHDAGVERVVVDGAHALGNIDVNMKALEDSGIDAWVGNGHKWLYSPKGSAVLWVAKSAQGEIAPTVVSSEWGDGSFQQSFLYTGTRDYTPFASIGAAMAFRDRIGSAAIQTYMRDLCEWGTQRLVEMWGTERIAPAHMTAMAMGNVRIPTTDASKASTLAKRVYDEYDIYIVVYKAGGDRWWIRLSAQIYIDQSDIVKAGEAVLAVLAD
eukprot:m.29369 g.29369  ORF g.29369 m.29369 type:complete len:458 (-) comp4589_c0_seq1:58-1431(-)